MLSDLLSGADISGVTNELLSVPDGLCSSLDYVP